MTKFPTYTLFFAITALGLTNCNQPTKDQPKKIDNNNLSPKNSNQRNPTNEKSKLSSYAYVVIEIDQPDIESEIVDINENERKLVEMDNKAWDEAEKNTDRSRLIEGDRVLRPANLPPPPEYRKKYTQKSHLKNYISDIIEVEDIDDNKKYKILDDYEKKIKQKLIYDDRESYINTNFEYHRKSKITKRDIYVFGSYSEASINKNEY